MSPRRDTAAVETIEIRRFCAETAGVHAGSSTMGKSRFDMNPRATAGIWDIWVNFRLLKTNGRLHSEDCEGRGVRRQAKLADVEIQ